MDFVLGDPVRHNQCWLPKLLVVISPDNGDILACNLPWDRVTKNIKWGGLQRTRIPFSFSSLNSSLVSNYLWCGIGAPLISSKTRLFNWEEILEFAILFWFFYTVDRLFWPSDNQVWGRTWWSLSSDHLLQGGSPFLGYCWTLFQIFLGIGGRFDLHSCDWSISLIVYHQCH